jgi:hypothetical protein
MMTAVPIMTTNMKSLDEIVREQFDAFERKERRIRMEERIERAAKLRLPGFVRAISRAPSQGQRVDSEGGDSKVDQAHSQGLPSFLAG